MNDYVDPSLLGIEIATKLAATRVVRFPDQLIEVHDKPAAVRWDNGPEFMSEKLADSPKETGLATRFIQPGKLNQNAFIERFNRPYREVVLEAYLFSTLKELREITDK